MNPDYQNITEKDFRSVQRTFRLLALAALILLAGGATFYHYVEDLKWLDALYFSTITLTTVGYGDIVPHTDAGKLFTVFYVICGIGIIAAFASTLVKNAVTRRMFMQGKAKKK